MDETEFHSAHPPGKQVGALVLEKAIGQGGEGIVYLAQHATLGRVVVKEYWPSQIALRKPDGSAVPQVSKWQDAFRTGLTRFVDIGRRMIALDPHQNIVKFHELFEFDQTCYLVMQFIEGEPLDAAIAAGRFSTPKSIVKLADQLSSALVHLHEEKIWHRDIAPDNILIARKNGRAVLIDFNAAKDLVFQVSQSMANLTKSGFSPHELYLSGPEAQAPTVDIYSASAVLYNAITGERPIDAGRRAFEDHLPKLTEIAKGKAPADLLAAIDAGLAVRPKNRPQSATEWRYALGFDRDIEDPLIVEDPSVGEIPGGDIGNGWLQGAKWIALVMGLLIVALGLYKCHSSTERGTGGPIAEQTDVARSPQRVKFDTATRDLELLPSEIWLQRGENRSMNKNMRLRADDYARFSITYYRIGETKPFNQAWRERNASAAEFPLGPDAFEALTYGETARFYIDTGHMQAANSSAYAVLKNALNLRDGSLIYAEVKVASCMPADTPIPAEGRIRVPCMDGKWDVTYSYDELFLTGTFEVKNTIGTLESYVESENLKIKQQCKVQYGDDVNINNCTVVYISEDIDYAPEIFELRYEKEHTLSGSGYDQYQNKITDAIFLRRK